jgi:hypothetical protein
MPDQSTELMPSTEQWPHAAIVVVAAILAIGGIAAIAMLHYKAPGDAVTVLGPVTAVISSLVAAYFGVRSGTLAMQKANEADAIRSQPEK